MPSASPLRILLVEDDELFRLGLQMRLQQEPGLTVVAEAVDGEMAVELTNQHHPDVVLLDVGLPGIGGVEACRQIRQQHPQLPILILTSHSQKSLVERLIAAGASGFCLKGIAAEVLVLALRSVAAGASWWDAIGTAEIRSLIHPPSSQPQRNQLQDSQLQSHQPQNSQPDRSTQLTSATVNLLTQREQEILALIAAGKTNQEIAEQLHIATGTVRVHVHAILQKLDLRDRTQAAIFAIHFCDSDS